MQLFQAHTIAQPLRASHIDVIGQSETGETDEHL